MTESLAMYHIGRPVNALASQSIGCSRIRIQRMDHDDECPDNQLNIRLKSWGYASKRRIFTFSM